MEIVKGNKEVEDVLLAKEEANKEEAEAVKKMFSVKSVFKVEVEDEGDEWICGWLRSPNISDFSMFTKLADTDRINALKSTFNSLWLKGDERIIKDEQFLLAAMLQVDEVMSIKASRVSKF